VGRVLKWTHHQLLVSMALQQSAKLFSTRSSRDQLTSYSGRGWIKNIPFCR